MQANGLLETSTIAAILLGAIAGGSLTDWSIEGALVAITACYAAAASSAIIIPRLKRSSIVSEFSFVGSIKTFAAQTRTLSTNPHARLALIGTALFWGAGAALRFLVIAWVPVALKVTNNRLPAFLTAMVAAGIVVGAALAARFVRLEVAHRALPAGVMIGVGVCLLPLATTLPQAFAIMAFVGISSGFFVVPLNAFVAATGRRWYRGWVRDRDSELLRESVHAGAGHRLHDSVVHARSGQPHSGGLWTLHRAVDCSARAHSTTIYEGEKAVGCSGALTDRNLRRKLSCTTGDTAPMRIHSTIIAPPSSARMPCPMPCISLCT